MNSLQNNPSANNPQTKAIEAIYRLGKSFLISDIFASIFLSIIVIFLIIFSFGSFFRSPLLQDNPLNPHNPNPSENTPTSPFSTSNPIPTLPNPKIPAYTPSAPTNDDSTPLVTSSNKSSSIVWTPENFYCTNDPWADSKPIAYISYKPYALLVTTNLIYRPCPCGVCDPSRSIAVPEHINSLGHDLILSVQTNLLEIIFLPVTNIISSYDSPYDLIPRPLSNSLNSPLAPFL